MAEEITTVEAARRYGGDVSHHRNLAASGRVKARKLGRDWAIDRRSLEAYLGQPHPPGPKRKVPA